MGGKAPDPVVAPPQPVPLRVQVVAGGRPLEGAEVIVKGKGKPKTLGKGGLTGPDGVADFGPVDPRTKFQITVRKPNFGPPGTPFKPGDNVVDRRARKNGTVDVPLTANTALLRIRVVDSKGKAISGATVGIDGAAPLPSTDTDGLTPLTVVPPNVQIRFHAQKAGFGPQPTGNAAFQRDAEVVGFTTLGADQVRTETLNLTRFVAKLTVEVETPGPGSVPGSAVALDDADVQVDGITGFGKTKNGGKITFEVPAGKELHIRTHKNGFGKAVTSGEVINLSDAEDDVKPGLKEDEEKAVTLRLIEAPGVAPLITPATAIVVLVKKAHTTPKRVKINVKSDVKFGGTAVLRQENPHGSVRVFGSPTGTDERAFVGNEIALTTPEIENGIDLFVQGASPTEKVNELKLTLELRGGVKAIRPPVSVTVTCVELTLDICQGLVPGAAAPVAFSQADKISVGRVVQRQDATNPRQRARLIVRAVKPKDFAGTLTLAPGDTRPPPAPAGASGNLALFDPEAPGTGTAKANPFEFAAANTDTIFHVEGTAVSGVERDTGYKLGLKDLGETDADHVAVTVIQVEKLQASLDSTKNAASGAQPAAGTFDTTNGALDFAAPTADLMVLVRDAGAITVKALNVKPPGEAARVRWQIDQDPADTVAKGLPALDKQTGQEVKVTPNAPGTFRLICYSDANANSKHEAGEELRVLRMVIVRITPQPGATLTANNVFVAQVNRVATNPAMRLQADFLLEGGGANRKRGLDQIVLANVGNVFTDTFVVTHPGVPPPGNPVNGTQEEDPDFSTNPAAGFPSPMVDTVNVATGTQPTGGTTPNRGNSVQTTLGDGPGGNGELRRIRSLDPPAFVWPGNHPTTGNPWRTTSGVNAFREWILAHATKFPRNYMALGTGEWTVTANGTRGAGGLWVDSVATPSSVTTTGWTIINPPRQADTGAPAAQVLGRSFVKEVGMIVKP